MSRSATPDDVLERLPGWQGASWSQLHGGLSNQTWLLEKNGAKAVLKIDSETRGAPYNSRVEEARVQTVAANARLANRVLHVDERILLSEFVEGLVWSPASLGDTENLRSLAASLRQLHTLPLSGRVFDAGAAAAAYVRDIDRDAETLALCVDIIESTGDPQEPCCCHNDLVAENIVSVPGIRFLDWEYACDNDRLFDLATIVEHHELSEQLAATLLDAYFDGEGGRWQAQFDKQRRLYRALLWLWLASRSQSLDAELRRVAGRLATSCS